jgi:hypothetical protein
MKARSGLFLLPGLPKLQQPFAFFCIFAPRKTGLQILKINKKSVREISSHKETLGGSGTKTF